MAHLEAAQAAELHDVVHARLVLRLAQQYLLEHLERVHALWWRPRARGERVRLQRGVRVGAQHGTRARWWLRSSWRVRAHRGQGGS